MAATRAIALLLLCRLTAHSHAASCQFGNRECAPAWSDDEAVDNDVHEVQLVQTMPLAVALADTGRLPLAPQNNGSHGAGAAAAVPPKGGEFGSAGCGCIAISWPGETQALLGGVPVPYPASIGSKCEAWDEGNDPACKGSDQPSYCYQKWCFVDGCDCNTTEAPKISTYFPNATFQGAKVYYSYATCGEKDAWTTANNKGSCVNQKTKAECTALEKCAWSGNSCKGKELAESEACENPAPAPVIGDEACLCIGLSNISGTIEANISNKLYDYSAELGSSCDAWDRGVHPLCIGSPVPFWCKQRWCYVDPCSCRIDVTPKRNTYVSTASFQGRPLFYSYSTCGEVDLYTSEENAGACPTKLSQLQCEQASQCAWTGSRGCVHQDILEVCSTEGKELEQATEKSAKEKSAADLKTLAGLVAVVGGLSALSSSARS